MKNNFSTIVNFGMVIFHSRSLLQHLLSKPRMVGRPKLRHTTLYVLLLMRGAKNGPFREHCPEDGGPSLSSNIISSFLSTFFVIDFSSI